MQRAIIWTNVGTDFSVTHIQYITHPQCDNIETGGLLSSRTDLEGGAPGARPPKFFSNTIFYYNIV